MSMKTVRLMDGFCIALFIAVMAFVFVLSDGQQETFAPVFSILYRIGAWIIGIGLLFTCLWGRGKIDILLGIILSVCYLITTFITLFGLMALTVEWELLWYVHPVLIIPICIIALWIRKRRSRNDLER